MKFVDPKSITHILNKCYLAYDPGWPNVIDQDRINGFKYHIERTAGLKLDFVPKLDRIGRRGYEINGIEVVDDPKYTMFLLKWS